MIFVLVRFIICEFILNYSGKIQVIEVLKILRLAVIVLSTFKAYYLRKAFSQALSKTTGDQSITLEQFWKNYDIRDALENIKDAWDQLTASNIRAVWQRILPHCANNFPGFDTVTKLDSTINEIKDFGINLGFTDLEKMLKSCLILMTKNLKSMIWLTLNKREPSTLKNLKMTKMKKRQRNSQ